MIRTSSTFSELMGSLTEENGSHVLDVSDNWMQGRTVYGGLVAAFSVSAALSRYSDLPQLRSAQFAFIGPASQRLEAQPRMLRKGKSTAFVGVDTETTDGIAARSLLCFASPRLGARLTFAGNAPAVQSPEECKPFSVNVPGLNFPENFDRRSASGAEPFSQSNQLTTIIWLRHRERSSPTVAQLLALSDAALPAAMTYFDGYKPLSTMTWAVDVVSDDIESRSGWWLVEVDAQSLSGGYSSQSMRVWNDRLEPVLHCRQHIAVFA